MLGSTPVTGPSRASRASASRKPTQQPRSSERPRLHVPLEPLEERRARSRAGRPPPRRSRRRPPRRTPARARPRSGSRAAACGRSPRSGRCPTARCRTGRSSGSAPRAPARRRRRGARRRRFPPQTTQRALTRVEASLSAVSLASRELSLLSVVAPVFNEEDNVAAVLRAHGRGPRRHAVRDHPGRRRLERRHARGARASSPPPTGASGWSRSRATSATRRRSPRASSTPRRRGRDDRRRPAGPARADPRAGRVVAQGLGRRRRGARGARGRDALQAR